MDYIKEYNSKNHLLEHGIVIAIRSELGLAVEKNSSLIH